jgi:putative endonuclease
VAEAAAVDQETAPSSEPWVLYLLECAGGRLYAGITNDLAARYDAHCDGRGARFTRAFPPERIVAACELPSRSAALKAEYALKQQPRHAKVAFLAACGVPLELDEPPQADGARILISERPF